MSLGLPVVINGRCPLHAGCRLMHLLIVACLKTCLLMAILESAAHAQAPSDPQSYCVNRSADFYPYTGEPCKSGYQPDRAIAEELTGAWLPCQEASALQWPAQSNYRLNAEDVRSTGL